MENFKAGQFFFYLKNNPQGEFAIKFGKITRVNTHIESTEDGEISRTTYDVVIINPMINNNNKKHIETDYKGLSGEGFFASMDDVKDYLTKNIIRYSEPALMSLFNKKDEPKPVSNIQAFKDRFETDKYGIPRSQIEMVRNAKG